MPLADGEDPAGGAFVRGVQECGFRPAAKLLVADADGSRAQAAADALAGAGYTAVVAVEGGYDHWRTIFTTCGRRRPPQAWLLSIQGPFSHRARVQGAGSRAQGQGRRIKGISGCMLEGRAGSEGRSEHVSTINAWYEIFSRLEPLPLTTDAISDVSRPFQTCPGSITTGSTPVYAH